DRGRYGQGKRSDSHRVRHPVGTLTSLSMRTLQRLSMEVTAMSNIASVLGLACVLAGNAFGQGMTINRVQHLNFDTPEAWAMKYFTSTTMMSGLQPPETLVEERKMGSVTVGLEMGWIPALTPAQATVGFSGKKQEDLNKAPIFMRPSV